MRMLYNNEDIVNLNKSYKMFNEGVRILKNTVKASQDIDLQIYRLEKAMVQLHNIVLEQMVNDIDK